MPVHHIPRATLHEDLLELVRKQGERVRHIIPDPNDPDRYEVVTEFITAETRVIS